MIYGFVDAFKEDWNILWEHGLRSEKPELQQRIQVAAFRMIATFVMAAGALYALNVVVTLVTFPISVAFKLALPISLYVLAHDVFIMCQNYNRKDFQKQEKSSIWDYFWKKALTEEEMAERFTRGTHIQPIWMWLYAHRNVKGLVSQSE